MALFKRYAGEFLSRSGVRWRCEIWQENTTAFDVEDLDFSGNPLEIEWLNTQKYEVICSSTATLQLIAPSDRKFFDLYTVRPGTIRMDVYRAGSIYWSGFIDPESASEPYYTDRGYVVTLNFTDFGIWKRLKYNMTDMQTMHAILLDALSRSGIEYESIYQTYVSTYLNDSMVATLNRLKVRSDNFYDEEGKAQTLYEVIQACLQPLGYKIIQKAGGIHIFDLNGLVEGASTQEIVWAATDQTISVDSVYNSVVLTFSPYADADFYPEFEYTDTVSPTLTNLTTDDPTSSLGVECYTYYPDYSTPFDYTNLSFTIFLSDTASGIASKLSGSKYYKTQPLLGGSEQEGVALWFYAGHAALASATRKLVGSCPASTDVVMTTPKTYVPETTSTVRSRYRMRVAMKTMLDARYNPFTDAGTYNEQSNVSSINQYFIYTVPVKIQLYDASGNILYHYTNQAVRESTSGITRNMAQAVGTWESGAAVQNDCLFHFHQGFDNVNDSHPAVNNGLMSNHQALNIYSDSPAADILAADDGQYIPLPPCAGFMEIQVLAGVELHNLGSVLGWPNGIFHAGANLADLSVLRWCLFGVPTVEIVNADVTNSSIETDDVEYTGIINEDAEEALEINTTVGTLNEMLPTARGLLFTYYDSPVETLTRAGRTNTPEQLLIGTLLSQHADRKDVLTGTAKTGDGSLVLWTDPSEDGKKFLLTSEVQTIIDEESSITAVETVEDDYTTLAG